MDKNEVDVTKVDTNLKLIVEEENLLKNFQSCTTKGQNDLAI